MNFEDAFSESPLDFLLYNIAKKQEIKKSLLAFLQNKLERKETSE